jgi:hypothetical protein
VQPRCPAEPEEVHGQAFTCPHCGGRMAFSPQVGRLACEFCGRQQAGEMQAHAGDPEQVLDFTLPTTAGHRWAEAQPRLVCAQCGAVSILPRGQVSEQCAYCGSNQLVPSASTEEIIDPQSIVLMKVDAPQAQRAAKQWLGSGLFAPDDLVDAVQRFHLRPGYYSCWSFDGTLEVRWSCEVKVGEGKNAYWEPRSGTETGFFDDVLAPGVRALAAHELSSIEPFDLKQAVEFKPEVLAGWPAVIYDRSLADASLLAREKVHRKLRSQLYYRVEAGSEKRNLNSSGGNWSGMTYRHVLLPVWIGGYHYRGKEYHLLVNGQSGKVGGVKPRDPVKLAVGVLIAVVALALLVWLAIRLFLSLGPV